VSRRTDRRYAPVPTVSTSEIASEIERALAVYVGPHTARLAVQTFSKEALGRGPETLTRVDVPKVLEALRPMLAAFIGRAQTDVVLKQVKNRVENPVMERQ